ncbi:hypothetical protein CEXT_572961 [Caerostris extrusa]|uniref:BPTI/Kunitz inhibitor domain-containing protein n=1 Tax=Caerostris extrusa TaxID=172846 RepID=A0AAV4XVH9_CAEEX|nr:hypothetical protein CEXT_572961 [Caerostris extrusa]
MRGPCLDGLKRFFYSTKTRSCELFIYGGCYGNHNNFVTKKEWRVLELYPQKDGIIRLVKLRTEKENILRPIQRLYHLELTPNYEQVVPKTQKVPEVITEYPELNTDSNETVPRVSLRSRNKTS